MDKPRVSIIMGIYNCADTLDEAVKSILEQTYQNWEMIMCDDGSTDDTVAVAQKYVEQDPKRFILLKNGKNKGLNYTLNRCLEQATGEFVARMDGDDISMPTRFEKEVDFLLSNPEFALVSTVMGMFDEHGDWGQTKVIQFPTKNDFCKHTPFFCHAACMIRKDVFIEVGGYTVDPKLLRVEDCHLWFKIYAAGYKGANIDEMLYKMRDDRNATRRRSLKARLNGIYVMWVGFHLVKMPYYKYGYVLLCAIQELIKHLIPLQIYEYIHRRKFEK